MTPFLLVALFMGVVEMISLEADPAHSVDKREAVCYGTLGCFSTDPPFTSPERPVAVTPESPDKIVTKFRLYTRENTKAGTLVDARHPETAPTLWTNFKVRQTQFLIHGFLDTPTLTTLWQDMKDELLKNGDYNVIIVDWSQGNLPPYDQACANARVVGAQIAELVKVLTSTKEIPASKFHIIGHSLGAHVCAYAGERIPGLGRITGLDPAGPYFENTDKVVRLDPSDAVFVDAIHTDAKNLLELGLGTHTPSGHADFFPNLGHDQPECTRDPIINIINGGLIGGVEDTLACSHVRAVKYFTESVNTQCPFMGFPCASEDDYKNNLCHSCAVSGGCAPMGFHADKHIPADGKQLKYYLSTSGHTPFCEYHLTITLKISSSNGQEEKGKADIVVNGDQGSSTKVSLTGDAVTFTPGHIYKYYVMVPYSFGSVTSVSFHWDLETSILDPLHWNILGLRHPKLYLDEIDIFRDEEGVDVHLCSSGQSVETGYSLTVSTKC